MPTKVTKEPDDQRRALAPEIATFKAAHPSNTYVFANEVTVNYKSHVLTFRDGVPYALEAIFVTWLNGFGITPTLQ